jgi:RNA polymerase sigma-70 factor (ECF subfamily)
MATIDQPAGGELQIARDRRLVQRLRRDDQRAMHAFYDEYFPKLYRYAARRMKSPQDIDDVVQAVLTAAARRIETYRGESTLLTWLIQICRHEVSKHYNLAMQSDAAVAFLDDDMLRAAVESLEAPIVDEPESAARRSELIACVQMALDQLPTRYADALELKYLEGFSSKEIASQLGIGDEAVQSLLARARRAFREICSIAMMIETDLDGQTHVSTEGSR